MTVTVANTELNNSFDTWRLNTNFISTVISNNVVTVTGTGDTARGGTSTGDGHVEGNFSATILRTPTLTGGNVGTTGTSGPISIESNTTIEAAELTINANTVFNANVDFRSLSGTDRLLLPTLDKVRVGESGATGQIFRVNEDNEPHFKDLKLRDLQGDHAFELTHSHLTLAGGNTAFTGTFGSTAARGESPHLIFSGGNANNDVIDVYLAGNLGTTGGAGDQGKSDLYLKLADTAGKSALVIADSTGAIVATIDSDGNAEFTGTLGVTGDSTLRGAANVHGNLGVSGNANVSGNAEIVGTLNVTGNTLFRGNSEIVGTLGVTGAATLRSNANVHGNLAVSGNANVSGNAEVVGTLGVTGNATLRGAATVHGNLGVSGNVNVTGNADIVGTLGVTGTANLRGNVVVGGDLTVSGTTTTVNSSTVTIDDNFLKLADGNIADTVDIGIYAQYNDGAAKYAGFFRDQDDTEKAFVFFKDLATEPTASPGLAGPTGNVGATSFSLAQVDAVIDGGTYS